VPFIAEPIQLSEQQRSDLNEIAQSRSLPAGFVFRAKLILMLAEGVPFAVIKERLQTTAPTISRWKQRFLEDGLEGLDTYHPGQPAVILTPALRAKILAVTRRKPKDGSTHWSCRKLAAAIHVSKDMVHRVWQEAGLKPHRLERYLASDDPDFETKAADVIGLYLNPPQHAAVFCVDEKTAIQALDRLDPVLPLSPGRAERHGFEYYRAWKNGRTTHQRRLRRFPRRGRFAMPAEAGDPHHSRQSVRPQDPSRAGFSGHAPEGAAALHADVFLVAESSRVVVRQNRAGCDRSRRVYLGPRSGT
jgi:transposase